MNNKLTATMNFFQTRAINLIKGALFCIILIVAVCKKSYAQNATINTLKISSTNDLLDYFKYTGNDVPLISGHRGGTTKGFPENCIATFENTLRYTPAFFEIDPRLTKDSVIVLMHDATLERTTNGTGFKIKIK